MFNSFIHLQSLLHPGQGLIWIVKNTRMLSVAQTHSHLEINSLQPINQPAWFWEFGESRRTHRKRCTDIGRTWDSPDRQWSLEVRFKKKKRITQRCIHSSSYSVIHIIFQASKANVYSFQARILLLSFRPETHCEMMFGWTLLHQ